MMVDEVLRAAPDLKIHVALAFCDPRGGYARRAAVVMASIFANTESHVCVHIIHDDTLTAENTAKLRDTAGAFGQEVRFINVSSMLDENVVDVSKLTIDGARGTLFRLLIPQLLDIPKIIYLDCDVVVNMDLRELWTADIGGSALGAVRDVWSIGYMDGEKIPWRLSLAWNALGIASDGYFNAGVLIMDLNKIRAGYDFLGEVGEFYRKYKKMITLADQDCLNYIFGGDVAFLDEKFNRINIPKEDGNEALVSIWHMAGGAKPWAFYTRPGIDELYWRYLARTPYAAGEDELICTMLKDLSSSPYAHHHSSDCIKRLKKQLYDNIFAAHIWTVPHILLSLLTRGGAKAAKER